MAQSISNIGLLGTSIDILTFDPLNSADPKTRRGHPVIALQINKPTPDQKYLIPAGSEFIPGGASSLSSRTSRLFSACDWQQTFKDSFRAGLGVEGMFEFSSSASFDHFREELASREEMQTFTRGEYILFSVGLNLDDRQEKLQIAHRFLDHVAALNPEDYPGFQAFVKEFGTHFTTRVDFGATQYQTIRISKEVYSDKVRHDVDIDSAAKATFWGAQVEAGYKFARGTGEGFKSESGVEASHLVWNGGAPKQDWDAWVDTVKENPAIVGCDLKELTELFTPDFFPEDRKIEDKRDLLARAIANYITSRGVDASADLIKFGTPVYIKHKHSGKVLTTVPGEGKYVALEATDRDGSPQQQWLLHPAAARQGDQFLRGASLIAVQSVAWNKFYLATDTHPVEQATLAPYREGKHEIQWLVGDRWVRLPVRGKTPLGAPVVVGQEIYLQDAWARPQSSYPTPARAPIRLANEDGKIYLDNYDDRVVWAIEPV